MPDAFKYRRPSQELVINGTAVSSEDGLTWTAPFELVANGSLSSLARAYLDEYDELGGDTADEYERWGMPATMGGLSAADVPPEELDPEYVLLESWDIGYLREHGVVVDVIVDPARPKSTTQNWQRSSPPPWTEWARNFSTQEPKGPATGRCPRYA